MFKKLCAAVIAVLLISGGSYAGQDFISAVSVTAQAAQAVWDGSYDTSWYDAEETELHISTAAEFAGLAQIVNSGKTMAGQTIYLDKNITLNDISDYKNWSEKAPANQWTPIGTQKFQFAGTFDAKNHTITGMCTGDGLFRYSTGTIKNIKLASAYAHYAGICYANSGTIDNCQVNAVVYNSSGNAGGICTENSGTISSCTMSGSVEASYTGGISACNEGTITKCKNTASITASSYSGGIVAYSNSSSAVISDSCNTGAVNAPSSYGSGGILGYNSYSVTISNVYNTGTITAYYAGGILGQKGSSAAISNAYNIGNLSGTSYTGGISGRGGTPTMTACYYLNSTALKGVGDADTDTAISKTEANMKKDTFAKNLGDGFVYVKNDFPKLAWEKTETPAETTTTTTTTTSTTTTAASTTKKATTASTTTTATSATKKTTTTSTTTTAASTTPQTTTTAESAQNSIKLTEYTEKTKLTVNYDGDIIWLSSNTDVAAVENGIVTAVGNGKAIIYAVCGSQRIETPVEVSYDYYLNLKDVSLSAGKQKQLEFHSSNNKEIYNNLAVWSSSDETVATVDANGLITAVSGGSAVITAKAGDVSVTCKLTVESAAEPAVSAKTTSLKENEATKLSVTDYSGSVTWVSSDAKVASVASDGTVKGVKAGNAVIYAMLDNGQTISINLTVTKADLLGDVTLDGSIDILDVITVNKAILGKETLTDDQVKAADINKNSVPDSTDSLMILKYIVGIVTTFE